MSHILEKKDLLSLEQYSIDRDEIRKQVINIKKNRNLEIGDHLRLLFENKATIQYQIQEMLRIEKIFDSEGIQEELDVYNPLIPNGSNLKATMMIEYPDENKRKVALSELIGIEKQVFFEVKGYPKVYAISNEDLDRETEEKTSSVHFMRFEFTEDMIKDFGEGTVIGVEHDNYKHTVSISKDVLLQLASDFDS